MTDKKISELANYTTPIDTDQMPIMDYTTSATKKITWANIKATLKTYFDTLYMALTGNQTIAGVKTFSSAPVISAITNTGTLTLPTSTDTLVGKATTDTLTNKRIQKRVDSQTTTDTITPEISTYDIFRRTAQAHALVINNHSTSTPADGEMMLFDIVSDATPRAITYGDKYVAKAGVALPSTTVASKRLTMLFIWCADISKWNLLYAGQEE